MKKKLLSALLLSSALLAGCGDDAAESADDEGCEHLQQGPGVTVTAATTGAGPAVSNDHKRYDITLADVTGGKGGAVSFAVSDPTEYVLFTSADVPVKVTNSSGQTVDLEESKTGSDACSEVKGRHTVPLTVGTFTLTFGPTTVSQVSLVIEEAGEHSHDE